MYTNILVPIDTSYESFDWVKPSLEAAMGFAGKSKGTIHLLSVVPDNLLKGYYPDLYAADMAGESKKRLEGVRAAMLPAEVPVELHTRQGGICTQILKAAKEVNANVIVMASHGPLARDYLLGSNAAFVGLHAPCSVFVVRE